LSHRHRQRPGVIPKPSEADIRILRRMLKRAGAAVASPLPFVVASEKAWKAVLPVGYRDADQCFVRLIRLGKGWLLLTHNERLEKAGTMKGLAGECREVLDGLEATTPRERKDIDG
jgi:hypothetical protein